MGSNLSGDIMRAHKVCHLELAEVKPITEPRNVYFAIFCGNGNSNYIQR